MLMELQVANFAIIESVSISFKEGLNILSGETGAGKSVLLKSLGLLMGAKAQNDVIRSQADSASIEGLFDISNRQDIKEKLAAMGVDPDEGQLVVKRCLFKQGKSRVYLNGSLTTLASLKEIVAPLIELTGPATPLIEMTGQHENRNLQSKACHLDWIDAYGGTLILKQQYQALYTEHQTTVAEIDRIKKSSLATNQRLDFLIYQRNEIQTLNLAPGEDKILEKKTKRIQNSSKLNEFVEGVIDALYGDEDSVIARLHRSQQKASEVAHLDEELLTKLEPLSQAKTLIEEVIYDLRSLAQDFGSSEELYALEERLSQLRKIQKKYGSELEDIIEALAAMNSEIHDLESSSDNIELLEKKEASLIKSLLKLGKNLHKRRSEAGLLLAATINDELADLNMKGLQFEVGLSLSELPLTTGLSHVEFMIRSAKTEEPKPLAKVASGGELSRILLALKTVIGQSDQPRTYLFDEVDAGISGNTAEKVGQKLKAVAAGQQVICVTHLPQVASFAKSHFYIYKKISPNQGPRLEVEELSKSKKINEIARLLSGEKITKTSLNHAKQLLTEAHA